VIWLVIFAIGAGAWRLLVTPMLQTAEEKAQAEAERASIEATRGDLPYKHEVTVALDSFSGYAVLRSKTFADLLRRRGVKLELRDDGANYPQRLENLRKGNVQMAAFTVDALIKTGAKSGELPATIVALIDETRGADAMLAYKSTIRNVDALNHPDVRFVLTPDSPSETLARVVMSTFALDQLPPEPFTMARDAADVYERYRRSGKDSREVFVLWEPYVSKILANESMDVVIDSSRFTGYIVDCLVAERDFLVKNPDVAQSVVECYFRALYEYRSDEAMTQLVKSDAGDDPAMDAAVSQKLVAGIDWKNTQENFAHFGLRSSQGLQHLADMIENITEVLINTGAIDSDPTAGQPDRLYFDQPLRQLFDAGFHPGDEQEEVRQREQLAALSDQQWESLEPVGTLSVPALVFPRGTDKLTERSERILDELVSQLETWPQYYVILRGNASRKGDLEANKRLAEQRAKATERYLTSHGVASRRIRAVGSEPSGKTSVSVLLGQLPY
jgi:outer membrane protein OmpA-like peptidoglycan-associated protein